MNDNTMNTNNNQTEKEQKKKNRWRSRPLVAVIGFFVLLFLGALVAYLLQAMWITAIGAPIAIAWAIFFSIDWSKDDD